MIRRSGYVLVATLPDGASNIRMALFRGIVVITGDNMAPMFYDGEKCSVITFEPPPDNLTITFADGVLQ